MPLMSFMRSFLTSSYDGHGRAGHDSIQAIDMDQGHPKNGGTGQGMISFAARSAINKD